MPRGTRNSRRVALLVETSRSYGRDVLRGIARFARTRQWSLLHEEMTIDALPPDWLANAQPSGVIARVDHRTVEPLRALGIPCVDVQCVGTFTGIPQVETDDATVSKLAFEHLWDRGFRRFAYCGFQFAHYSEARLQSFRELTQAAGCSLSVYQSPGEKDSPVTTIERSGLVDMERMMAWLTSLQAPTGMLVCNDIRGQQVLNACHTLGLAVPDDLGVIGVDDDDAICPLSNPPLSSVRPDAERVGYRAAEVLDQMMLGQAPDSPLELIPPTSVVQRLSTQVMAVDDRELARVVRFIREFACDGIDVNDVAEFTTLSRRQLERRFRTQLNQTPHEAITAVQVERVRELLRESDLTLEQMAPLAGYRHKERLAAVFKRESGETPGAYRRRMQT